MKEQIGHIVCIRRYPVKSMQGEDIDHTWIAFNGIVGDRVYAFIDAQRKGNEFPYFSVYLQKELLLYKPHFKDTKILETKLPIGSDLFTVSVETPEGEIYAIDDPAFLHHLEKKYGRTLFLRFSERGMYHSRPVSLVSMQSIAALQDECNLSILEKERFRMNIYVAWNNEEPYFENSLVGKHLCIGDEVEVCVVKKDHRCIYTTYNPKTLESNTNILRTITKKHDSCFGIYASVGKGGRIQVGDPIFVQ